MSYLDSFNELNVGNLDDAKTICSALEQNPFEKEIDEKMNCIEIVSSSSSMEFLSGTLIGIPDNQEGDDRFYPNPDAENKGGDLGYGDYSEEEALMLLSANNKFLLDENITLDHLWSNVNYLFNLLTIRNLRSYGQVADRFIDRFMNSTGGELVDDQLNQLLIETNAFKNDVKDFGEAFSCALLADECTEAGCVSYLPPENPLKNDAYRFVYTSGEGYVFRGPFVLIHDTDNIEYNLRSFDGDVTDGKWEACFSIRSIDNFGLDTDDFLKFQDYDDEEIGLPNAVGIGSGIASWWLLQHVYGFKPFKNVMLFEVCVEGNIDDCNCNP